jgi:hypothetical protein
MKQKKVNDKVLLVNDKVLLLKSERNKQFFKLFLLQT